MMVGRPIAAHKLRIAAAGYVWDKGQNKLVKLTDLAGIARPEAIDGLPFRGDANVVQDGRGNLWYAVPGHDIWVRTDSPMAPGGATFGDPTAEWRRRTHRTWAALVDEFGPIRAVGEMSPGVKLASSNVRKVVDRNGRVWVNARPHDIWFPIEKVAEGEGVTWSALVLDHGPLVPIGD